MKRPLPHETGKRYLVFAATGTDLIFNRGVELPPKIISADELLGDEAVASDRKPDLDQLAEI